MVLCPTATDDYYAVDAASQKVKGFQIAVDDILVDHRM